MVLLLSSVGRRCGTIEAMHATRVSKSKANNEFYYRQKYTTISPAQHSRTERNWNTYTYRPTDRQRERRYTQPIENKRVEEVILKQQQQQQRRQ